MMKKSCFVIVLLFLLFGVCSANAARLISGDWEYEILDNNTAEVTWYYGTETTVTVPDTIEGIPVTSMYQTFQDHENVRIVNIPDTITRMGDYTFWNCNSLFRVNGSETTSVSLGYMTFHNCQNLQALKIGPITSLGDHCFKNCSSLISSLTLDVTEIPNQAFYYCSNIPSIQGLEEKEVSIGPRAFYGCSKLKSMPIETITGIEKEAFRNCKALVESYRLGKDITVLPEYAFYGCQAMTGIRLPSTLTELEKYCLHTCTSLESLTLPLNLRVIGEYSCMNLIEILEIDIPDSVETIGKTPFLTDTKLIVGEGTAAYHYCVSNPYQQWRLRTDEDINLDEIGADATNSEEMAQAVVEALITDGMSDYEKALKLHDYIIYHASYDTSLTKRTAANIFFDQSGVCEAYSAAYHMLLDEAGIQNCFEYNNTHRWNMACLDGIWTHIDCTWDDPVGGSYENHIFFGVTNYALQGVESHLCTVLEHMATDPGCSYLYRMGNLNQRIEEVEQLLKQNLDEGFMKFTINPDSFFGDSQDGLYNRLSLQAVEKQFKYKNHEVVMQTTCIGNSASATIAVSFVIDEDNVLRMPNELTTVFQEAFSGVSAEKIVFGPNVTYIAPDSFEGIDFVILSGGNNYVKSFAETKGFLYEVTP